MTRLFFLWAWVIVASSCNDSQNSVSGKFEFKKLIGDWRTMGEDPYTLERWTYSDNTLSGTSFSVAGSDMNILETIRLDHLDGTPVYSPKVVNQNGGKEVLFVCINQNPNRIEFVNQQHDFPQVILYEFINPDSLQATISSFPLNDKSKKITFGYSRVK
ncbi:MAG: DUF6265 family protein [Flavobacteriales bacterium]